MTACQRRLVQSQALQTSHRHGDQKLGGHMLMPWMTREVYSVDSPACKARMSMSQGGTRSTVRVDDVDDAMSSLARTGIIEGLPHGPGCGKVCIKDGRDDDWAAAGVHLGDLLGGCQQLREAVGYWIAPAGIGELVAEPCRCQL